MKGLVIDEPEIAGDGTSRRSPSQRKHSVLIADDNEIDRFFLKRAIVAHAPRVNVVAEVGDGEEVIAYLCGDGEYSDRQKYPLPDLLIMDLRMPQMPGIKLLEWLRNQNFPSLKIAVLSDTSGGVYKEQALGMGHHFYEKHSINHLVEMVKKLRDELENR